MEDDTLEEYAMMLPEPERDRFRRDVRLLTRRMIARDHAHQTVHLAWLSAKNTGDRIREAIARSPRDDRGRIGHLARLGRMADELEEGLKAIDRKDMGE